MYRLKIFRNLITLRSLPWVGMGHSRVLECLGRVWNGHCPIRFEAFQPKIDSRLTGLNPLIQIRTQYYQDQTYLVPAPRFVSFWVLSQVFCPVESSDIRIFFYKGPYWWVEVRFWGLLLRPSWVNLTSILLSSSFLIFYGILFWCILNMHDLYLHENIFYKNVDSIFMHMKYLKNGIRLTFV